MSEACAPTELFPDMPTAQADLTLLLFEEALTPFVEELTQTLEAKTLLMLRYQNALWVL